MASELRERFRRTIRLGRALRLVWEGSRGAAIANLVVVFLSGLAPLALLYVTKLLIDEIVMGVGAPGELNFAPVGWLIALAAAISLIGVGLRIAGDFAGEMQRILVTDHVLGKLYTQSAAVDLAHHEDPGYHDRLHRTLREAPYRPGALLHTLTRIVHGAAMLAGVVFLLVVVHWAIALLLFAASLPGVWVRLRFTSDNFSWLQRRAATERELNYTGALLTTEPHAKELRVWGLGRLLVERFGAFRSRLRGEHFAIVRSRSYGELATQTAATAAVFGSLAYVSHQTLLGALTIGSLVMYFQAIQRGQGAMQEVLGGLASLYEHNLFLSNFDEFMALRPAVSAPAEPVRVPTRPAEGLVVNGVSFSYPFTTRAAVDGIDLAVRPGEMVALVGENGSGKTTLTKLLCRLYDPDHGAITFGGIDLRRFDPELWRRSVAVVFQDFSRYSLTLRENVWFGDVDSDGDGAGLADATQVAGLDRLVERLPAGHDTRLGKMFDGGVDLSGGEWQKVALARAFYRSAQLLILDEPSSALDAHAEIELFEQIRHHARDRAVIVVSHRFSTVRMADRIYMFDDGAIREEGTHDELVARRGSYARLFEAQAAMYRTQDPEAPFALA